MANWIHRSARLLRHRWAEGQLGQMGTPALIEQLTHAVIASEFRHTGQVRICIEAGLPVSYVWRGACARERAVALFSKLRVWDTEHNNGVLIYLLLADHALEIVADRGLACHVPQQTWDALTGKLSAALSTGHYAEGLMQALADASTLLEQHFPCPPRTSDQPRRNELPDTPFIAAH
ncbi:TPM domain-containing protein [Simplicispira psychrophila]|uniref:TPM domain-containing protein n=1 Tax=Simplicispira psychrophila TaxID=80882 RepID=UPI00055CB458|nr:TPM domain-containing protein [Simplicispira psychrophila]